MPTKKPNASAEVRAYIAAQPPGARRRLKQMRTIIRAVAPKATEGFSYRIPGFRLNDKSFVWYAGFKRHTSLFPITGAIQRAFAKELEGHKTARGTVQFPLDEPLPTALFRKLVRARLAEMKRADAARS
jgi:uncharacterized protein YdhG (YjbR/CyaY superfamily)